MALQDLQNRMSGATFAVWVRSAELLARERITMVEFLQASGPMADAYQGFYQLAREGRAGLTEEDHGVLQEASRRARNKRSDHP